MKTEAMGSFTILESESQAQQRAMEMTSAAQERQAGIHTEDLQLASSTLEGQLAAVQSEDVDKGRAIVQVEARRCEWRQALAMQASPRSSGG